jgi:Tfp pilus assembly protein PilN
MEQGIMDMLFNRETVFFALFLYLFYTQLQEKKEQNTFLLKQQGILSDLTNSFEKMAQNQEKLTERIERIEITLDKNGEGSKNE